MDDSLVAKDILYLINHNFRKGFLSGLIVSGLVVGMAKLSKHVTISLNNVKED